MQQSSATPFLYLAFGGLQKIAACSQSYLAGPSCTNSFGKVSSLHLISFLMLAATDKSRETDLTARRKVAIIILSPAVKYQ